MNVLRACALLLFLAIATCSAAVAQPLPTATFSGQSSIFKNSTTDLRVGFTNTGTQLGYYPMIELKLPAGLECDSTCRSGITLVDLGGAPVTVTGFGPAASNSTYTNPITGNGVPATAGQSVLFISLPTGSIAPGEPAITYSIPATLKPSAVLGVPLPVTGTAVFALGSQADGIRGACGAAGVNTICNAATPFQITPTVLELQKSVVGLVDGATSTGPNYPRRYTLDVRAADTEVVNGTTVTDTIPDSFVLSSLPGSNCKTNPGSLTFNPALGAGDTCTFTGNASGGGSISVTYASITGNGGIVRQIEYQGYVQKFTGAVPGSHVVPQASGTTTSSTTSAQATYRYDPGSGAQQYTTPLAPATLQQRSLYTTKSISNLSSATLNAPGHTLRHTLIYDISDYFSFDDLLISDAISDGQTYIAGSLSVTVQEGSTPGTTRNEAQLLAIPGSPLQPITRDPATGSWSISLDLSEALVASAPDGYAASDDVLTGDENRTPSAPSGSPTRVVITYTTQIDEEFEGPVAGTQEVDGGDVVSDTMGADFRVQGTANRQTMSGPTASITVTPIRIFEKEVAFENGGAPSDPLEVSPTETITYRLSFQIPTGDVEGLVLRDFLPSPLFSVSDPDGNGAPSSFTFDPVSSDAAPAPGVVRLTTASAPVTVGIATDAVGNSVSFSFDNESNASSANTLIELMFTVTATSSPMADDLLLVNVAYLFQNSSQSLVPINQLSAVSPLRTSEPKLVVRKAASQVVSGGGSIGGTGAAANFTGVQPGARLRFSVEVENTGSYGAVDVSLVDTLPTPLTLVPGTVGTSNCDTGGGITDTSSSTEINLSSMEIPAGQTCTILYQVDVDDEARFGAVITNTATARYSSTPGGPVFAPERDTATTTINSPTLTKALVGGTSTDSETPEGSFRPGESALFDVVVTVPPGTADTFTVRERDTATGATSPNFFENFEAGTVIFPSVENNAACGGDFNFVGNTNLCFTLNPNVTAAQTSATVHQVNLGTVRNLSGASQSFTFRYRATVRGGIVAGAYTNRADVQWVTQNSNSSGSTPATLTSLTATAPLTVVRPVLGLSKTTSTGSPVVVGQQVTYALTLTNTGGSAAHDVANIVDTLPAGLGSATLLSVTLNGASVTASAGFNFSQSGSIITVTMRNLSGVAKLAAGDGYVVTFRVPLETSVGGAVTSLVNTAQVASYSSGSSDGGPRETYTDVPQATVSIGVNSSNIFGRAVFSKETAGGTPQNGVAGSTVSILGTSYTTTTDSNGNFSFSGIPNGTYTIRTTSVYGDVIGEETITINNADVQNVVFQARPRIVLTKSTSTTGPVTAGQSINYTLKLENVGNYPAFQMANIVDTMVKGMETATLVSAKHSGTDVTGAPGFSFQQSGLTLTISVRNPSGEARLDPGESYEVAYRVPVSTTLKGVSITLPNSATVASYATTATTGATTETFVDVRSGQVRVDVRDEPVTGGSIYGRAVFSKETAGSTPQNGVTGTTVAILGTSYTTTTDANGNFTFANVPNGTYTIRATSIHGDVIGEETVTVNNADVRNIVFQARPRIVLTKSTSTAGPVAPGDLINYTLKLENVGNYPAFQVANIVDELVKGMDTATLISAKHTGVDITGASGFSFQQNNLTITISVRNRTGEARLDPGETYQVSYRVSVSSTLKTLSMTFPNSASLASYATAATTSATTETYLDVRCGDVRLDLRDVLSSECVTSSQTALIASVDTRAEEMARGVARALALRKQYAAAGYCKAPDNGCFKCNRNRSKCRNVCKVPSAQEDRALEAKAAALQQQIEATTQDRLVTETWSIDCTLSRTCLMSDMAEPKSSIADAARGLADMVTQVLDSCCLRTSRASQDLKRRRAALRRASKRDLQQMSTHLATYPSPALLCE